MKFEEILPELRRGEVVRRGVFQSNLVVFMQIPTEISWERIPNIVSIPEKMKKLITMWRNGVSYHDQFIMYDFSDGTCTYYPFDGEDFNADDWEVVTLSNYDPYADYRQLS